MVARLGESSDPKAFIPGEPSQLHTAVGRLAKGTVTVEGIGDELRAVRTPGWAGQASEAFWDDFSPQKNKWYRGAESLKKAASALQDYADVLEWGQAQAAQAINLYDAGDQAGAEATLKSACDQVETAGGAVAKRFEALGGSASDAPDWLHWAAQDAQSGAGATGLAFWEGQPFEQFFREGTRTWGAHADPQAAEEKKGVGTGLSVAGDSVSGDASVWGADAMGRGNALGGDVAGRAGIDLLGVAGSAGYGVEDTNLSGQASGKAYLAQASAEGRYEAGRFESSAKAEAFVGGQADVGASVGSHGARLGAEGFVGGKATTEAHASVAGVGVGGTAEGWVGIGAEAHLDAGMQKGKLVIGGSAGAAVGFGGQVGGQVEIDPGKVTDAMGDAADAAGDWSGKVVGAAGSVFG
ncbi:putative T7SS-secreted protein [Streptomyces sp. WG-D5]